MVVQEAARLLTQPIQPTQVNLMDNLPIIADSSHTVNLTHLKEEVKLIHRRAVMEHHNKITEVRHQTSIMTLLHSILTTRLKKRRKIAQFRKLLSASM